MNDGSAGIVPLVYVTGLSGSGKSTIIAEIAKLGVPTLDFSSLLREVLPGEPVEWEDLPSDRFDFAVQSALDVVLSHLPSVLAGHVFAMRHGRREVIAGAWDAILPCKGVVWLDASGGELQRRRPALNNSLDTIDSDRRFGIEYATTRCELSGTAMLTLDNERPEQISTNVSAILRLLDGS